VGKKESEADAIVITGATATGKTALAIEVARRLSGEIISLDSRQVYEGMDIGTAKASADQRRAVPHHGIDVVSPDQHYSAGRFARAARNWIAGIRARGRLPIFVGGTGFFLKALTEPLFEEPELREPERSALRGWLGGKPTDELRRWLNVLDPELNQRLALQGGRQRVLRGLEIALLSGYPLSWWHRQGTASVAPLRPLIFVLELPRHELYQRINERVMAMLEAGLVDEVRLLKDRGFAENSPGLTATGYTELLPYLRGEITLPGALDAIQRATRRYARRQLTWFRHQLPDHSVRLDARASVSILAEQIVKHWQREVSSAHRN
jgi:tRNA dimethylallyltransferase